MLRDITICFALGHERSGLIAPRGNGTPFGPALPLRRSYSERQICRFWQKRTVSTYVHFIRAPYGWQIRRHTGPDILNGSCFILSYLHATKGSQHKAEFQTSLWLDAPGGRQLQPFLGAG